MKVIIKPVQILKEETSETLLTVKEGGNIAIQDSGSVIGILSKKPIWNRPKGMVHFCKRFTKERLEAVPPRTSVWLCRHGIPQVVFNRAENNDLAEILEDSFQPIYGSPSIQEIAKNYKNQPNIQTYLRPG